MNTDVIPPDVTTRACVSVSSSLLRRMCPWCAGQGTEPEEIVAFSYSPFILLRGDDIIAPFSEVIGITRYTDSTPSSCQHVKLFPARSLV